MTREKNPRYLMRLDILKPTDEEILGLALRETDPSFYAHFSPIAKGRIYAVLAIVLLLILSIPHLLKKLFLALVHRQG